MFIESIEKDWEKIIKIENEIQIYMNKKVNILIGVEDWDEFYSLPQDLQNKCYDAELIHDRILNNIDIMKTVEPERMSELPDGLKYEYLR